MRATITHGQKEREKIETKKKRDDESTVPGTRYRYLIQGVRRLPYRSILPRYVVVEIEIKERKNLGGCQSTMFISFMKYLRHFTGEKRNIIIN